MEYTTIHVFDKIKQLFYETTPLVGSSITTTNYLFKKSYSAFSRSKGAIFEKLTFLFYKNFSHIKSINQLINQHTNKSIIILTN